MSKHNQLVWDDFLLCIGMELAFTENGENPIDEQKIAEKMMKWNQQTAQNVVRNQYYTNGVIVKISYAGNVIGSIDRGI